MKIVANLIISISLLLGQMAGSFTPANQSKARPAPSVSQQSVNSTTSQDIRNGLALGSSNSPQQENVPILSEQIAKQAQAGKANASPQIKVSAEPAIYIPGRPIQVRWTLLGISADQRANTSIVIHAPAGVSPVNASQTLAADSSLTMPVNGDSGAVVWKVDANAILPLDFTFDLALNGEIVNSAALSVDQAQFSTGQGRGASFNGMDGKVRISIPVGASNEPLLFNVRNAGPNALDGISLSWQPMEILAVGKNSGKNIYNFKTPITIQIQYDPTQVTDADEKSLTIYYYDPDQQDWFPMETQVDTRNKILTAYSDHLTVFDYKANNWQSQSLPTVDTFKVSDFTGAATYAINLWTPPGQGGLQPSLTLSYNSQVFDESSAFSQPSWVGMGWNLDTGAIIRNMHGTDSDTTDDTFSISAGGVSGLLLPTSVNGTVATYNTADQSFMKVQFDSSTNAWTAWANDGTKYVFSTTAKTNSSSGCSSTLDLTWRWSLTTVTDTHNNTLTYTYYTETKSGCANQIAVYPDTITYPNNKYRVVFTRAATVRTDYQTSWTSSTSRTLYGTLRLGEVDVQYNPAGTWTNVKRYVLSYAPNTATSNIIYPNFVWSAGGKTLTLLGVQEFGSDGSALPAVQFTYGDSMHVTNVNNGQGGQVQMTYSSRWSYFDDINKDLRSLRTSFGTGGNECYRVTSTSYVDISWVKVSGSGTVRCDLSTGYMQIGGVSTTPTLAAAEHTIPENMVKPGARYWYYVKVRSISGTQTFNWGLRDTGTNTLQMLPAQSVGTVSGGAVFELGLEMPATFNPTNTKLRLDCSYCYFKNIQFIQWPLEYFVTQRTVTAQPTSLVSTYTYQYDNPAPNTDATSAAAAANGILYTNKLREFRGNSMSEVVDPAGTATLTWFNQSDALKGKPYDNLVMQQSFYDSLDTINSNWVATGGTQVVATNYQIDYDNNVQSYNSAANWNVSFARAASTLTSGKMAIARVRLSGANAQGEAGLLSGSGQFFGVTLSAAGGAVLQNGATLIPAASFKLDTWYVVMFFVDDSNGFRARIWDANNPSVSGEAVVSMAGGQAWKFRERINNGTQSLGLYIEGTPYTETITNYASTLQYDTVTGNGIPDLAASGLMTYTDLQVAWNYPTSTERRNYNGGSAFVGTKQVYAYATQYGNVTSTTDYSGNNGSWTAYRATQTEYYPNATTYVVSLPARQVTFACAADCTTNRVSESLNFYDSNTAYTGQPTKGELTTQRAWVQNSDYSQVSYTYDSFGNRQTQSVYTGYGTASAAPDATTRQWTFTTYDTDGYNTYATTVANNLKQGMQTSYNYALGLPVSLTDPNGAVTSATYDGFGRIKTITAPYDSSATLQVAYYDTRIPFQIDLTQAVNGTASIRLSRFYDGAGRQIQTQTVGAVVNGTQKNVVVDDQYNSLGQLVKQTAPYAIAYNGTPAFSTQNFSNPYTSTSYDAIGRTLSVTAPNGNQTNYIYTRLTSTVTDPKQNATTTTVDVWGRTTLIHPPTGPDVSYTYDVLNRLTKATRAGYDTIIQYDALGRKLNMSDPDMGYWQYQYDAVGNLKVQTDARGCILSLGYDSLNRLQSKASTGSCGQQITLNYYYDADDPITPAYDPPRYINTQIGRRTGMSDGSGQTAWTYDLRGRLTQEAKGIIGASLFTTSWTYNSADLPVTMTYPDSEIVTNGYNSDGSLKTMTSSLAGQTYLNDMQYDEAGRLKLMDFGAGVIRKTFSYFAWNTADQGGLLQSAQATRLADSAPLQNLAYTYDKNGNALTITDAQSGPQTQTFTYDALNRIKSASATGGTNGLYSESYDYDSASGNLSLKAGLTYNYDNPAHVHAVTSLSNGNSYVYDLNGNMTQRNVGGQAFDLVYDAENRLTNISANGVQIIPSPTPTLPVTLTPTNSPTTTASNTPTQTATSSNTPASTDTAIPTDTSTPTDTAMPTDTSIPTDTSTPTDTPAVTDTPGDTPTPSETPTETSTPSPTGPPTNTAVPSETPTPTETSTPTQTATITNTPTLTLPPSNTPTFTLTPSPTFTSTPVPTLFANATFVYNGDGARVKSVTQTNYASMTTYFVGNYYEVANGVVTKYYYAGTQRIAMRSNGTLSYLLGDHLGSTSITTDASGNIINQTQYKAWGEERYSNGTKQTNYTYTGQYSDSYINLLWYGSRRYDPELGRFIQPDSIVPVAAQGTQAYDRYGYANNNPVRYTDPTGHYIPNCWICSIWNGFTNWFTGKDVGYSGSGYGHGSRQLIANVLDIGDNANNLPELLVHSLLQEDHTNITGDALESIERDPAVIKKQDEIVARVQSDPRYGVESFTTDSIGNDITVGKHGSLAQDAEDPLTWMMRAGKLDAKNISVTCNGEITLSYSTRDTLDLTPDWGGTLRPGFWGFLYNSISAVGGFYYHDLLGGNNKMTTSASWVTSVHPNNIR